MNGKIHNRDINCAIIPAPIFNSLIFKGAIPIQQNPGSQSGMRAYTCATRKTLKRGGFLKTTRDAGDAFRGAKTPFFRKRGVSNFSGVAIRVMFSVL